MAHPYQPKALVGNPVSDAYFGTLSQRQRSTADLRCASCAADLREVQRMSDGVRAWCHVGCHDQWVRGERERAQRLWLTERGWSKEKQEGS